MILFGARLLFILFREVVNLKKNTCKHLSFAAVILFKFLLFIRAAILECLNGMLMMGFSHSDTFSNLTLHKKTLFRRVLDVNYHFFFSVKTFLFKSIKNNNSKICFVETLGRTEGCLDHKVFGVLI